MRLEGKRQEGSQKFNYYSLLKNPQPLKIKNTSPLWLGLAWAEPIFYNKNFFYGVLQVWDFVWRVFNKIKKKKGRGLRLPSPLVRKGESLNIYNVNKILAPPLRPKTKINFIY
jgi:hypothetical protein